MLRIYHEAHTWGLCGICGGRFIPDESSKIPADIQIREQHNNHQCKEENRDKVISPNATVKK
jgi:hypothetical protein